MRKYFSIIVPFFFLTLLFACQEEANDDQSKTTIIGIWDLEKASRNGKPTETLNNMRMEFVSQDSMFSNLQGSRERQSYYIEDNTIFPSGARMNPEYKIITLNDSLLKLQMVIKDIPFDLEFKRNSSN